MQAAAPRAVAPVTDAPVTDTVAVTPEEAGEIGQSDATTPGRGRLWTLPLAAAVAGVLTMAA